MDTTHESLHFTREMMFGRVNDHERAYKFLFESLFCLTKLLNMATCDILRLIWTDDELMYVEL